MNHASKMSLMPSKNETKVHHYEVFSDFTGYRDGEDGVLKCQLGAPFGFLLKSSPFGHLKISRLIPV
jgi:hypothetical protein